MQHKKVFRFRVIIYGSPSIEIIENKSRTSLNLISHSILHILLSASVY